VAPNAPQNGKGPVYSPQQPTGPPYASSTTAKYTCNDGYRLVPADAMLTCDGPSKSWMGGPIQCQGSFLFVFDK